MEKISVLIVEDHKLLRETWVLILNSHPEYTVVGSVGNAEEGIALAKERLPAIVMMDINLPGMNGLEATQEILKHSPESKVLGVSLHTQPAYARTMVQRGAMGYITKNSSQEEMFHALGEIRKGKKYLCKEIKDILSSQLMTGENEHEKGLGSLSRREEQIIYFIKTGKSSKEIADELSINAKTVEVHRHNILKKLKLRNVAMLVDYVNRSIVGTLN